MPAISEGIFRVIDQASRPMKTIEQNGSKMVSTMTAAGKALDDIDSPKITNSIKATSKNVEGLGRTTETTGKKVKASTTAMGNDFQRMRDKGVKSIEELTLMLKKFEKERATAQIDVDIAKAEAKIRIIKQQIRTVSTLEARKELGLLDDKAAALTETLVGGGGGGGPGGASRGAGGLAGGFFAAGGRVAFMAAAMLAAAPAVVALTGAIIALVGSLGAAVGGAGALGVGVFGAAAVGIASIVLIAKPAIAQLKDLKKVQDGYNKAVEQYGVKSSQAIKAHKALISEQRKAPGASDVLQNAQVLGGRWKRATGPARQDFFGILNAGLQTANSLLPTFGDIANRSLRTARAAVEDFLRPFRGDEWRTIFRTLGDTFGQSIGPFSRAIGSVALFFGRIARAASPMVIRMFESLERSAFGLAASASDGTKVQRIIESLVDHTKEWARFAGAAVHLMFTLFGSGAKQGKDTIAAITDQLNKWADWIEANPDKMQAFFDRTIDAAGKLVTALGHIASTLADISDALLPVLNGVSGIVNMAGGSGSLTGLALLGGATFASRKLGGRSGTRGGPTRGGTTSGDPLAVGGAARTGGRLGRAGGALGVAGVIGGQVLGNAVGGRTGSVIGSAAAGAGLGATLGSVVPGLGTLAGAGIGGGLGGLYALLTGSGGKQATGSTTAQGKVAEFLQKTGGDRSDITRQIGHLQGLLSGPRYDGRPGSGLTGPAASRVQGELKLLRPMQQQYAAGDAGKALSGIQGAYDFRRSRGDLRGANQGVLGDVKAQMAQLGPQGRSALRTATAQWAEELSHGTPAQKRVAKELTGYIVDRYRDMGKRISTINEAIGAGSKQTWDQIEKSLSGAAETAQERVTSAFTKMQDQAIGALIAMGYSRGAAKGIVRATEAGNRAAGASTRAGAIQGAVSAATGTKATSGGVGAYDKPIGDGPGAETRAAHGGTAAGAPGLMGASAVMAPFAKIGSRYGLGVSSGLRPGAITASGNPSLHGTGHAIDESGPAGGMLAYAKYMATHYGSQLAELIHTPLGYGIKNGKRVPLSFWGSTINAMHKNHVHVGYTGEGVAGTAGGGNASGMTNAAGALGQANIKAPWSGLGGLPGAMADAASAAYASGINQKINGAGPGGGGATSAGGKYDKSALEKLWISAGGPPGVANMAAAIALAESAGNPGARNSIGATGLWQIYNGPNTSKGLLNPMANAKAAVAKYTAAGGFTPWTTYTGADTPGHAKTYLKYMGDGTGFGGIAAAPHSMASHAGGIAGTTVKGAGGRMVHVAVSVGKIVNYEEGDIERILDRELNKVARKIRGGDDEDELS